MKKTNKYLYIAIVCVAYIFVKIFETYLWMYLERKRYVLYTKVFFGENFHVLNTFCELYNFKN